METRGSFLLTASPDSLWPLLLEPNILTAVMPGGQVITRTDADEYAGKLTVRVGPLAGAYRTHIKLSEVEPPIGLTFDFAADSQNGRLQGHGRLYLQPYNGRTRLHYEANTTVSGELAQYATPLLETSARAIVRQSLERLEQLLQDGTAVRIARGDWPAPAAAETLPGRLPPPLPGQPLSASLTLLALAAFLLVLFLLLRKNRPQPDSAK